MVPGSCDYGQISHVVSFLRIRFWIKEDGMEVSSRCRREDAALLRVAVGEGSASVCRRRGGQTGAWWRRVHRTGLGVRSENHSSRPPRSGRGRGCGGGGASEKKGGTPARAVAQPTLEATLRQLLQEFTAGDPMREGVLWTNLSLRELSRRLVALGSRQSAHYPTGAAQTAN